MGGGRRETTYPTRAAFSAGAPARARTTVGAMQAVRARVCVTCVRQVSSGLCGARGGRGGCPRGPGAEKQREQSDRSVERPTRSALVVASCFFVLVAIWHPLALTLVVLASSSLVLCAHMAALSCVDRLASSLAFFPPDPPSYCLRVSKAADASSSVVVAPTQRGVPPPPAGARCATLQTDHATVVVAAHVPPPAGTPSPSSRVLVFAHGNAVDLAQTLPFASALGRALRVGVVAFDYSGYGASTGTPSAANAVRDLAAVCAWTVDSLKYEPASIVLYGQSIGTGPVAALAADAASPKPRVWKGGARAGLGGVILHSPLASGVRVFKVSEGGGWRKRDGFCAASTHTTTENPLYPSLSPQPHWRFWPVWLDIFPVVSAAKRIDGEWCFRVFCLSPLLLCCSSPTPPHPSTAPLLVLHGKRDAVVPFACGEAVARAARAGVEDHLFVETAGHDDVEAAPEYLPRIKRFLESEARRA